MFIRRLIIEIELEQDRQRLPPTKLKEDNKGCRDLAINPSSYTKLKHVEIRHFLCQQLVQSKDIEVELVSTKDQIADVLTKISNSNFDQKRTQLGVISREVFAKLSRNDEEPDQESSGAVGFTEL